MTEYYRKKLVEKYQKLMAQDLLTKKQKSYVQYISELTSITTDIRKLERFLDTLYLRELELKAIIKKMREQT